MTTTTTATTALPAGLIRAGERVVRAARVVWAVVGPVVRGAWRVRLAGASGS